RAVPQPDRSSSAAGESGSTREYVDGRSKPEFIGATYLQASYRGQCAFQKDASTPEWFPRTDRAIQDCIDDYYASERATFYRAAAISVEEDDLDATVVYKLHLLSTENEHYVTTIKFVRATAQADWRVNFVSEPSFTGNDPSD